MPIITTWTVNLFLGSDLTSVLCFNVKWSGLIVRPYTSLIIGTRSVKCENFAANIFVGFENHGLHIFDVRFNMLNILQGQME